MNVIRGETLIDDARWIRRDAIALQAVAFTLRVNAQRVRAHASSLRQISSIERARRTALSSPL